MIYLMIVLAVLGGAFLSIQAAINSRLSESVGVLRTTFLTFAIGTLISVLLIIFFEPIHAQNLLTVPKWQLLGAFLGVPYILIMSFAVKKVGTAIATVAVIFGQLLMSLIIDNNGWFENSMIDFSINRLIAILCLLAALLFIYKSNQQKYD